MLKKIARALSIVILSCVASQAQTTFITKGKIEFERKTNTHRLYFKNSGDDSWTALMKKEIPQFKTDYFDLIFDETSSLYKPGKESAVAKNGFFESPAQDNFVYKNFTQQLTISQKNAFDNKFLLTDSLKTAKWRMEAETRTIAGFECHKAITTICDSVVVVAFYTDQIISLSGPESFSGLPGMIMGLAVPRLYTTWFATKLENITSADEKLIAPPAKGKKATLSELNATILSAIKNWGAEYRDRSLWFTTL